MPGLRELGEREVLRRLAETAGAGTGVRLGIGDDAALLSPAPGEELAVTVDAFVEGRHWRREWISDSGLGARLAEANLSDLAAMAARPRWALLSHGLRGDHDVDALLALQRGAAAALARHGAAIVGGNLTAVEGAEWMSLTLIGGVPQGRAWTRAGARNGDRILVTGWPGRAGAAARLAARMSEAAHAAVGRAWREPRARVELALAFAEAGGVRAAIDLSDGFAGDLANLCAASGAGAAIDLHAFASDPDLERAARDLGVDADALRLGPSDDYELLLAVDPERADALHAIASGLGVPLMSVGEITGRAGEIVTRGGRPVGEIAAPGFDHFGPA